MFKHLQTFKTVYETRNFSHAAEQLFISQPTVSTQIKQLESELNTTLFTRNGRQEILPTASGTQLYHQAQKLLEEWAATKQSLQTTPATNRITCRIAASHTTASVVLPTLLQQLAPISDHYNFQVTLANSTKILTQMTQHKLDFGLVEKPIVTDRIHRLAFGQDDLVHAGDFASPLWLIREPNSGVRHYTDAYLKAHNIKPAQAMVIHSNQIIADLLSQGVGQSIISKHVVTPDVPTASLSANYHRQFYLLTQADTDPSLQPIQTQITQSLQKLA
ncbi:LysR family transcriptional regulator [Lactiplantibacillus mudanjiangensis]|uniref:LysR family transcriptional regulator [Lactobacillus sp.] n=1 Tax=Lactiplantibacillus mudanjiangensis TaxID=1296538 RepID=A0A660E5A3_9LACO|nr:LysR family transcriptional regulator [Lactiplantibacillus mudanjiangensis]VDG20038.1 LysR family transcriptional regulator [Lactobacillus sp.] [Lactiplantibacillus mudanjiangensis]VDG26199.1 LysR family transcriptional regulator [Lactobacillus sp.] [Lactiplantibacillus mudanjiangensis]VDG27355.1 LysR family transcriptional regulator [Lactobacillus sp.] [Lactiplantibacillus mudanjiangensis]